MLSISLICFTLMRFLLFFLPVTTFFGLTGRPALATGGSWRSRSSISSAARFLLTFLPLPSPSLMKSPTIHLVKKHQHRRLEPGERISVTSLILATPPLMSLLTAFVTKVRMCGGPVSRTTSK